MNNVTGLIDRYIAAWNETDAQRREELITQTWTETATYVDPMLEGEGHSGIDAMIRTVQERFPDYRFRRTSEVDAHHDRVRFTWEFAPEGGPAFADGTDFGIVAPNGRLQMITGFFDHVQR